jgi:hypothetical protein
MPRRWPFYSLILAVSVLCLLSLSGCNVWDFLADLFRFGKDAGAQQGGGGFTDNRPVQTLNIVSGSFFMTDTTIDFDTNVEVKDEVIVYKGITTGKVFFLEPGSSQNSTFTLTAEDVIIERPGSNSLTIIRPNQ